MRTSRLGALALGIAGLALAACDPATLAASGNPSRAEVTVAGRSVTIATPPGLCIDGKSTTVNADGAFLLISDCGLLGARGADTRIPAALTASVSSGGLGGEGDDEAATLDDLEAFIATRDGLALLGRSGQDGRVRALATLRRGDVLYVLVEDRGAQPVAGIEREFWRAFLEVNGRITVLSVLNFEGSGLGAQASLDQLSALARTIQAANPRQGA